MTTATIRDYQSIPARERCTECDANAREVAAEVDDAGIPAGQAVCCEAVL